VLPIFFRLDGEDFALVHRAFADGLSSEFVPLSELEAKWLVRSWRESGQVDGMTRMLDALCGSDQVRQETRILPTQRRVIVSEDRGEYLLFRYQPPRPVTTLVVRDHAVDLAELVPDAPVEAVEHFIEVLVVDERDRPLLGVACIVELSNGQSRAGRTDDNGLLRIDGIVPAGACSIRFPALDGGAIAVA
jgi:hypothetical protein